MAERSVRPVLPSSDGFTPRQIIGLVLAFTLLLVVLPIGARAAGQLMTIVDSSTTSQARVIGGRLATNGLPVGAKPFRTLSPAGPGATVFTPPAGTKNLAITSITLDNQGTNKGIFQLYLRAPCTANSVVVFMASVPSGDSRHFDFPEPLLISQADSSWCVRANAVAGMYATVVGYSY